MKATKKQISEWSKEFPHLTKKEIESRSNDYKTERGLLNYLKTANAKDEEAHNKPLPVYIEIEVEWKKSSMWGWCPRASMRWEDADGAWHRIDNAGYASGCGYDKHSAAVAEALNRFKNLRYAARNKDFKKAPYGIRKSEYTYCYFEGGVGMSCYPRIMNWLGYNMRHVAEGNTYDKWVICEKKHERKLNKAR